MASINPAILKSLREQRGFSQEALADKAKVSKRQIQRIETLQDDDHSTGMRGNTVKKIAGALGVPIDALTGEMKLPSSTPEPPKRFTDVMRETFGAASNLNFDLVEARYGVSPEEVVQIAPLLFAMYAEKARKQMPPPEYVPTPTTKTSVAGSIGIFWDDWVGPVSCIRKVNVFGNSETQGSWLQLSWNPFVELLDQELKASDEATAGVFLKFQMAPGKSLYHVLPGSRVPYVEACSADLDRLTCLNPKARQALKSGHVRIGEIPEELMRADRGVERVTWILEKLAERQPPRQPTEEAKEDTK